MAQNLRTTCRKLILALGLQHHRRLSMTQFSTFSTKAGRTVTKYVISEYVTKDGKQRYVPILESWSLPEVVRFLADLLNGEEVKANGG